MSRKDSSGAFLMKCDLALGGDDIQVVIRRPLYQVWSWKFGLLSEHTERHVFLWRVFVSYAYMFCGVFFFLVVVVMNGVGRFVEV